MAAGERISVEARLIDNVSKAFGTMGKNLTSTTSKVRAGFAGLSKSVFNLRNLLLGAGLLGAFNATAGAAGKFEAQMREVSTLSEEVATNIGAFSTEILELSKASGQGLDALTKGLYDSVSAGIAAGDAMEFMEAATRLAIGGATDTATAIDGLTTIVNAFALEADQATDVSDAFFTAMKFGKTTVGEMAQSVGTLAPTARAAGLAFDEMLGGVSALTKAGFNTREAVVGMQGALVGLNQLSDDAKSALESQGLAYRITGEEGETFIDVLNNIRQASGGSLEGMKQFIPEIRGARSALALTNEEGKNFQEVMRLMGDRAGETAKAYAKMTDTFEFKSARVKQSFQVAFIETGNQLMPTMKELADSILENMDTIKGSIAFAGAVVRDTFSAVITIVNGVRTAFWGMTTGVLETLQLFTGALAPFSDKVAEIDRKLNDVANTTSDKAVAAWKDLAEHTTKAANEGWATVEFLKAQDSQLEKTATSVKDLTQAEKELIGLEKPDTKKPSVPSDTDTSKIDAAKRLQEELRLMTLAGYDRDLEELRLFEEQKKRILEDGKQGTETLERAVGIERQKIKDKAVAAYIKSVQKENMEVARGIREQIKIERKKEKAIRAARRDTILMSLDAFSSLTEAMGVSAKKQKRIAQTEAAIQGFLAVQKALAAGAPPWSFIQAGLVGVKTAANVMKIQQQNFAEGGMIMRPTMALMGEAGTPEAVLNPQATMSLGVGGVNALNSGQPPSKQVTNDIHYSPTITIEGGASESLLDILREDKEEFAKFWRETKERGYLDA